MWTPAASRLELEITESVLMHDGEETLAALHQLRGLGCRIAMDDFGIGYSSLSYLRSFPFDKIKIDRSFIQDLDDRHRGAEIVRAIAALRATACSWLPRPKASRTMKSDTRSPALKAALDRAGLSSSASLAPARDVPEMMDGIFPRKYLWPARLGDCAQARVAETSS